MMKIRNIVLWGLTFSLLITTSWFSMRILQRILRGEAHEEGLADGNWVIAENLHFFNKERNMVSIYSFNLPAKIAHFGDMELLVVPLILEHGRHIHGAAHFVNVNDGLLLGYGCYLALKPEGDVELALAILHVLEENDSFVSERYASVISMCQRYINGDGRYQEVVQAKADEYAYHRNVYMGGEEFDRFRQQRRKVEIHGDPGSARKRRLKPAGDRE